ncbi:WhiB family transcriptional regulator [Streptomyces sp. NPDC059853]|uniref:WhiB family transcriptional regulator n=1 Tax=Streptomyces sp. NPDC059853 TaxID=3346973 RepID=UPI003667D27D
MAHHPHRPGHLTPGHGRMTITQLLAAPAFLGALRPGESTPCRTAPRLFDPEAGVLAREEAREMCGTCRLQEECRQWAIATGEPRGLWGGLTPDERRERGARLVRSSSRRCTACGQPGVCRGQQICGSCQAAAAEERRRAWLRVEHARPGGGSVRGYRLELLLGLETCEPCRAAWRARKRDRERLAGTREKTERQCDMRLRVDNTM